MISPRADEILELADGRRLAYAEYGSAAGEPIFLFHGLPGSRLSWGLLPGEPIPAGLRVIAPDRPGYGRSDPKPCRSLACAWKMPERLTSVGVVSGPAPPDAAGVFVIRRNPARYINTMKLKVHEVDRQIVVRPEIQAMLARDFTEALRSGAQGMVDDMAANHGRSWGFPLEEIQTKVRFWICELDRSVPPAMGRYLSRTVPNSESTFVRDAGHLSIPEHLRDVLDTIAH